MWRSYDPAVIDAELAVLKRHGLTMTRSFFYWPDFMPGPYEIDETMTARFADFLDRHAEQGLTTIPTFIVGHMSGENWDPAWRERPPPVQRRLDGRPAGLVRRRDGAPLPSAPRGRGLAGLQRDAALRRVGHRPRDRRDLGADHQGRGPRGRRAPAVLAGRRRLGHRGHRQRQRLPPDRRIGTDRLPRPAHLPGRRRPDPAALRGRRRLRAVGHVRQAGDHGGVRRQLRLRLRRQRGHLLPAPAAQHAARRAPPGGSRGTTPTSPSRTRTRTGITRSSRTSGSPTPTAPRRPRSRR